MIGVSFFTTSSILILFFLISFAMDKTFLRPLLLCDSIGEKKMKRATNIANITFMIANIKLMDMGDNGWFLFRIFNSKGVKKCQGNYIQELTSELRGLI